MRASLFGTGGCTPPTRTSRPEAPLVQPAPADRGAAREGGAGPARAARRVPLFEEGGELRTVALTREWTRIGRSLAADVRFDDPTVSRRHALIVRHPDGVRLLDDRSLNGVFVNGARVDGQDPAGRRRDHRRALPAELRARSRPRTAVGHEQAPGGTSTVG